MFISLNNSSIKPDIVDYINIPEINLSSELRDKIRIFLDNYLSASKICEHSAAVKQSSDQFVFFPNQYYVICVKCRKYAEALKAYCDFLDSKRQNNTFCDLISSPSYQLSAIYTNAFDTAEDSKYFAEFLEGGSSLGKKAIDSHGIRGTKDIFQSRVLAKLQLQNVSSSFIGELLYYLVQDSNLFDELETEVIMQINNRPSRIKLSSTTKICAKQIIDYIYQYDELKRVENILKVNEKYIKLETQSVCPQGNLLRYMFALPESDSYDSRAFNDIEYIIRVGDTARKCRLTTEWSNDEYQSGGGNYLSALIQIVNKYYSDLLEIKEENNKYYLCPKEKDFKYSNLPNQFNNDFAKRYITSLLAKPFVILTGNSGTGKTRIAKQLAEYLEVTDEDGKKNWEAVAVGADWTDNTKILGYFNPLGGVDGKGAYVKTKILELIERANENKEVPYFLILDEMNLSHVERYFADFLSRMETPDLGFVLDGKGKKVPYPKNLFVTGTVNIDETTYMFSPKVLDRANVIEFRPGRENVLGLFDKPAETNRIEPAEDGTAEAFLRLAQEIRNEKSSLTEEEIGTIKSFFGTVYEKLEAPKQGFEFAYRTVREIREYISAAKELEENFALNDAIDEQLLQKVLPKIHGNRKEVGKMLEELKNVCGTDKKKSLKKLEEMEIKLDSTQYVSFI